MALETAARVATPGGSLGGDAWRRLRRNRLAVVCLGILIAMLLFTFVGPLIAPYDPQAQDRAYGAQPPSAEHWLGTDVLGRDLMTRIMHGGRLSLLVGLVATLVSGVIGVTYGAIAGWLGGRTDALMMRVVDILYGIPFVIFVILLMVAFGRSLLLIFVAIGAVEWLTMARIVRGQVLTLKHRPFVEAARSLGHSGARLLVRHILPNALGPIIVYATLTVPAVMLLESFLSFLGIGVPPPLASWGTLLAEGAQGMEIHPWLLVFPALFFSVTLFALNFLGDGLRDALDPQAAED